MIKPYLKSFQLFREKWTWLEHYKEEILITDLKDDFLVIEFGNGETDMCEDNFKQQPLDAGNEGPILGPFHYHLKKLTQLIGFFLNLI